MGESLLQSDKKVDSKEFEKIFGFQPEEQTSTVVERHIVLETMGELADPIIEADNQRVSLFNKYDSQQKPSKKEALQDLDQFRKIASEHQIKIKTFKTALSLANKFGYNISENFVAEYSKRKLEEKKGGVSVPIASVPVVGMR